MADPSSGTVTFLFTDIEGSTRLWEDYPDASPGRWFDTTRSCATRWSRLAGMW